MNLHRALLICSLIAPAAALAAIDNDTGGGETGGGGGGGGGTTTTPPPAWTKSFTKSGKFGTTSWGAGYKVYANFSATPKHDEYNDKLAASLGLETHAKVNGSYLKLASVRAQGSTEAKRKSTVSFGAYVGSAAVYSKSYTSETSTYTFANVTPVDWHKTFFERTVNMSVGVIPVTFTVKATGKIKFDLTGKLSNVGVEIASNPGGNASLYASAAIGGQYCVDYVGCVGASAGVYSDVKLVEAAAPVKGALWWSLAPGATGVRINFLGQANATISSLDGELGVFAKACLGACIEESAKLVDWDGVTATFPIANVSGYYCLAGTCTLPEMKY